MMNKLSLGPHPDFPFCTVVQDGDFCYTDPYPSNEQLTEYYNSTYRAVRQESPTSDYVRFMKVRAKVQAEFIRQGAGKNRFSKVLDIGSGCGALLAELRNDADYLEGWEPDVTMSKYAHDHFTTSKTKFTNDLFIPGKAEQQFDLITMSHVLEHVPHPAAFLARLRTHHLSQGGLLFIEVPNDPAWWVQIQIEQCFQGLGHVNYFTPQSLAHFLRTAHYSPLIVHTRGISVTKFSKERTKSNTVLQRMLKRLYPWTRSASNIYKDVTSNSSIYLQLIAVNN